MFYEPTTQDMYDGGFPLPQKAPNYNGKFKSSIDNDLYMNSSGKWYVAPKEYPLWYGIENIGFIWRGSWSDPEIEYKGKQFSCYYVEDTMWERFHDENVNVSDDDFAKYMFDNIDEVYELCDLIVNVKEE